MDIQNSTVFDTRIGSSDADIALASQLVRQGEVVAFPTETVYGLGANALSAAAVNKIFAAKGRPSDNPLIVHLDCVERIETVVSALTEDAKRLFRAFAPGPITVILPKRPEIPYEVTAGLETVGVRIPSHPMANRFLRECGVPVAAPSANKSKRVSPTTARAVFEDMQGRIPLILDGGQSSVGIESTVITLATSVPTILRPGAITPHMIKEVLGECATSHHVPLGAAEAPGMKYTHYRTTCDFALRSAGEEVIALATFYKQLRRRVIIFARSQNLSLYEGFEVLDMGDSDEGICANIYEFMRNAEKKYDVIICERLIGSELCDSVMNRLTKADNTR